VEAEAVPTEIRDCHGMKAPVTPRNPSLKLLEVQQMVAVKHRHQFFKAVQVPVLKVETKDDS